MRDTPPPPLAWIGEHFATQVEADAAVAEADTVGEPLYQVGDHALYTPTDEEVEIVGRTYAVIAQTWVYVIRVGTVDRSAPEWELADLRRPTDPLPRQATGQNRQDMEWTSRQLGDSRDV